MNLERYHPGLIAGDFLQQLRPGGPWLLSAILPDGPTGSMITEIAKDDGDAMVFVNRHNGARNLYFSVNPTFRPMTKKASKDDIAAIEFMFGDLDPRDDETPEAAKERYLKLLDAFPLPTSALIDSGNGLQPLWGLRERVNLAGDTAHVVTYVEAHCKALMEQFDSTAGTQNIDRILRLPGTLNLPNKKKRDCGRVACETKLIKYNGAACDLAEFAAATPINPEAEADSESPHSETVIDWSKVAEHAGWLKGVADLPDRFNLKGRMIVEHTEAITELNTDLKRAGLLEKGYSSWSSVTLALASIFKADGRFTTEQIAAALMCPLPCNRHVTKHLDIAQQRRAIERALDRSYEPTTRRVARALPWRECRDDGSPVPSMHNARLAITALGIECGYDTFHNKMLFGHVGDDVRHELQAVIGEVNDDGVIRLRQLMSDRFGFDMGDKHTRDAIRSLALEHCFDPVREMLDEAEGNWDRTKRLDRMAVTYFNAEDTPLNRAMIRITMIAAVRRVRQPGCKFDTILMLESPEGWNKSTVWRVLAGDENFSDASILGKGGREVQEQLSEIWIHENADLAGMRKAEIEEVKTFASRQADIARPAYGYFVRKQPRHSIEVGTTNSDEYLQSQTGNRRFWPLAITAPIDLDQVRRDRLQLWGEAAAAEAAGESIVLDAALWPAAGEEQEERRTKDPWEQVLADIPAVFIRRVDDQERVASADLLSEVLKIPLGQQEPRHAMRLATTMRHLGWSRAGRNKITIGCRQVRGYFRWVNNPD